MYKQVNSFVSTFTNSFTSIGSKYDGAFMVTPGLFEEGVNFHNGTQVFWKKRDPGTPNFKMATGEELTTTSAFSLVQNPINEVIEVIVPDDELPTFVLFDNSGREVEIQAISNQGNHYRLTPELLSSGMYFLHCSTEKTVQIIRLLH